MLQMMNRLCAKLTRLFAVKQPTITKGIVIALFLSVASLLCLAMYVSTVHNNGLTRLPPEPTVACGTEASRLRGMANGPRDHTSSASLRIDNKVLVLIETQYSKQGVEIVSILEANRIRYKVELAQKSLPSLTRMDKGKYGVIVFENFESYLNMDQWNRELLDKYCLEYNVGVIAFTYPTEDTLIQAKVKRFPLFVHTNLALKDYEINSRSDILRVTRAGEINYGFLPGDDWVVFVPNHTTYEPLAFAKTQSAEVVSLSYSIEESSYITAIQDRGFLDGIQRIYFGNGFKYWLHIPLFLDALSHLSHGKFSIPLDRYVLIDIDDIFVGKSGTRMKADDVIALVDAQTRVQKSIRGFHFNLGFSGKYFHSGSAAENKGDDLLLDHKEKFWWFPHTWRHLQPHKFDNVSNLISEMKHNHRFAKDHFMWFCHTWSHSQPHLYNLTVMEEEMSLNKQFMKEHGIPVNSSYAVAPHHSGVFPVHEPLYEAWRKVWGIKATSTEEYPHLRPARRRRGFIHRNIMVLPRQTCGLFTHTILIDKYPGGSTRLEESIRGGELFQTFLFNPVMVFMTHMSNYGNDRLGLYTFESVVKFVQCWTNLQLKSLPPLDLAKLYFKMYPDEEDPVWRNPCDSKRHLEIWSEKKTCGRLPHFLVIGPQKTGTTALYTFLSMHPALAHNFKSETTFEEVQFFNGRNYYNGVDWYMQHFPSQRGKMVFEKSANYFDADHAPKRGHALLPNAKLISILINPAKRAYSWYQHQRSHNDKTALEHTFYEVVSADDDAPHHLRELRNRCLEPGLYAIHLEHWLSYYSPSQLMIIDGEELKSYPIAVMDKVQLFLNVEPYIDYSYRLKYNPKKGFFCQVVNGDQSKCLGRSKGRLYPQMELKAEKFLSNYYRKYNVALSKLLTRLGQAVPKWLAEELRES